MAENWVVISTFVSEEGTTTVYDSGIVEAFTNEDAYIDVPYLLKGKQLLETLTPGKKYYIISESQGFYRISKEAKALSATSEYSSHIAAVAVVTSHIALKVVLDFYLKINKPAVATKGFNNKQQAIKWLKDRMEEEIPSCS